MLLYIILFRSTNQEASSAEIHDNPIYSYSTNDVKPDFKKNSNSYEIVAENVTVASTAEIQDNPIYSLSTSNINTELNENSNPYEIAAEKVTEKNKTPAAYETLQIADVDSCKITSLKNETRVFDRNQEEHENPYDHIN